jgi:hypothetical protein
VIDGTKARLFAHGAAQPCLIVKDMKFGDSEGAVTLFVGPARKATSPILNYAVTRLGSASCASAHTVYWQFAGKSEVSRAAQNSIAIQVAPAFCGRYFRVADNPSGAVGGVDFLRLPFCVTIGPPCILAKVGSEHGNSDSRLALRPAHVA